MKLDLIQLLQDDRKAKNQTVEEFAEGLGISVRMWTSMCNGSRRLGGKSLMGILHRYPKKNNKQHAAIRKAAWDYIEKSERAV